MLNFWEVKFPVFNLRPTLSIQIADDVVFTERTDGSKSVIDDRNMPGETLGMRRLQVQASGRRTYKLETPIYGISDLLHQNISRFIDNSGRIFNYKKSRFVTKECFRIHHFEEYPDGYAVVVYNLHCKFWLNRTPRLHEHYAQVLRIGHGFVLYDLLAAPEPTGRIKI